MLDNYKKVIEIVNREKELGRITPTMGDKVMKLNEELGEFTAVHLESTGYKFVKEERTREAIRSHILEELSDVQIMIMDIFNYYDFTKEEIETMVDTKLDKWNNLIDEKLNK